MLSRRTGRMSEIDDLRSQLATAVAERDNWIETARVHAKNEAYYRNLIVTTLAGTPAAFVSDDGSAQQDVLCAKLPELYAAAVSAREEAERLHLNASALLNAAEERLLAVEARAAEAEADVARLERLHAACDATIRELTNKALAAVRGQEAAEARAERLVEALAPFADPERYNTTEEECRENKAMRWCAVHSFRWPCPVGPARAALAAKEGLGETAPTDAALRAEVERLEEKVRRIESACGLPDPAEACRVILAIAAEEGK